MGAKISEDEARYRVQVKSRCLAGNTLSFLVFLLSG